MIKTMHHANYCAALKRKSIDELRYIVADVADTLRAYPDSPNAGYYEDERHYATAELQRRLRNERRRGN